MWPFARRVLPAAAAVMIGAALVGGGLAAPAAASAPRNDPTLTIRVGGDRFAENGAVVPSVTGLDGVTFTVSGGNLTHTETCVSGDAGAGLCRVTVPGSSTYTVTQTGTPGGWFSNTFLGVGTVSPGPVVPTRYDTLSVTVGTADLTVPAVATNTTTTHTARSGMWALSRDNPPVPAVCGLRIALLFDLSSSITPALLPLYKDAGVAFVDALHGTPSAVAVFTFGTVSPAPNTSGTNNVNVPVPVTTDTAGVAALTTKIRGLGVPSSSYTNWDNGLWQIHLNNAAQHYDDVIVLTDGDPTRFGSSSSLGGLTSPVETRFAEVENGIFSANTLKAEGVPVFAVGFGPTPETPPTVDNLRAISADGDFFTTTFAELAHELAALALTNCAGIDLVKTASPKTYDHVGQEITYHYTVTNTGHFFDLTDVHVDDNRITGPITCTPSTIPPGGTATCTAIYHITQADLDRGHVINTATATGTANGVDITSPERKQRVKAIPKPAITLVKTAFPREYAAPGQIITYTYKVTNTGNVTLHDITITDDRVSAPITCPVTTLAPGETTYCKAAITTTEDDVLAGQIVNTATVEGHPPTGPPVTDTDTDTVTSIARPGIEIQKTAFPTEYAVPGQVITYSYLVTNTGNVTLTGVTVDDNRLGLASCPLDVLEPGENMTCTATHTITAADVTAGHIDDTATATGHPPAGPPVTDSDSATVTSIHRPGIQVDKIPTPATYSAAGQTITFTYLVTNTGNVPLTAISVTDSKVGVVRCMAVMLLPGASTTCHATYTTTAADVSAGHAADVATATGHPPVGPPVTDRALAIITALLPEVPVTG
jgi:ethanolamine utilization microcompartment shell protein EutS